MQIADSLNRLQAHIDAVPGLFQSFSGEELLLRPAPMKWSRQEILGHLIDSAINNLKRFTEIQFLPQPFVVIGYRQVELVEVNHYQDIPLEHLLQLWQSLNQQVVYMARHIPLERLNFPVDPRLDDGSIKDLGWLINDYVTHLEHHLAQVNNEYKY